VEGRFCSSAGTCEPRIGASDEPGCACTAPGRGRSGDLGWLLALAVVGAARRARQRPRGRLSSAEAKRGGCCASSRTTTSSRD
jgi:MYXO-CTERM domain-containing protein